MRSLMKRYCRTVRFDFRQDPCYAQFGLPRITSVSATLTAICSIDQRSGKKPTFLCQIFSRTFTCPLLYVILIGGCFPNWAGGMGWGDDLVNPLSCMSRWVIDHKSGLIPDEAYALGRIFCKTRC